MNNNGLTHLTESGFNTTKSCISPKPNSVGLTGGVCKEQGHIHRVVMKPDY